MNIWISYAHADKKFVERLKIALTSQGYNPIAIEENISPGESILSLLEQNINKSDCFLLVFSSESLKSQWFSSELFLILDKVYHNQENTKIIPLILNKNIKLPSIIDQIAYADFTIKEDFEKSVSDLTKSIQQPIQQNFVQTSKLFHGIIKGKENDLKLQKLQYYAIDQNMTSNRILQRSVLLIMVMAALIVSITGIRLILGPKISKSKPSLSDLIYLILSTLITISAISLLKLTRKRSK